MVFINKFNNYLMNLLIRNFLMFQFYEYYSKFFMSVKKYIIIKVESRDVICICVIPVLRVMFYLL